MYCERVGCLLLCVVQTPQARNIRSLAERVKQQMPRTIVNTTRRKGEREVHVCINTLGDSFA